jgi:hypothetical protein
MATQKPNSGKPAAKNLDSKYADAARRAGGDLDKIELQNGENIVRLVDADFEENFVVFVEDTEGKNKRISMGLNMTENKEKFAVVFENFPDIKPQHKYYFKAVKGASEKIKDSKTQKILTRVTLDNQVKLFEIGPMVFKQIAAIQQDSEYPSVDEVNLKITKTGKKLDTDYQVLASNKATALPADLEGDVDLKKLVEETQIETVYEILGLEYTAEETAAYEEEQPAEEEYNGEEVTEEQPAEEEYTEEGVEVTEDQDNPPFDEDEQSVEEEGTVEEDLANLDDLDDLTVEEEEPAPTPAPKAPARPAPKAPAAPARPSAPKAPAKPAAQAPAKPATAYHRFQCVSAQRF